MLQDGLTSKPNEVRVHTGGEGKDGKGWYGTENSPAKAARHFSQDLMASCHEAVRLYIMVVM